MACAKVPAACSLRLQASWCSESASKWTRSFCGSSIEAPDARNLESFAVCLLTLDRFQKDEVGLRSRSCSCESRDIEAPPAAGLIRRPAMCACSSAESATLRGYFAGVANRSSLASI